MPTPPLPTLHVYTTPVDATALDAQAMSSLALAVAELVDPDFNRHSAPPMVWLNNGEGLVAVGVAAQFELPSDGAFAAGELVFDAVVAAAHIEDSVRVPGTGLVAFTSFPFDVTSPDGGVIIVPRVVVGLKENTAWITTSLRDDEPSSLRDRELISSAVAASVKRLPTSSQPSIDENPVAGNRVVEAVPAFDWRVVVRDALSAIDTGQVSKIVVARGVDARADKPIDIAAVVGHLVTEYPQCWTFQVDNLVGATPELLLRRTGSTVESRVLAGTAMADVLHIASVSAALEHSDKDQSEHQYAVDSVVEALVPFCLDVVASPEPFVLALPNVMHLATDVRATLNPDAFSAARPGAEVSVGPGATLRMVDALHPTAAVGGTPTSTAVEIIRQIEGLDRGRYAAPVGWLSSSGDGEFGIALRSAQVDPGDQRSVRLYAGCGIVAGSDPDAELAESEAKLSPMRMALGISAPYSG